MTEPKITNNNGSRDLLLPRWTVPLIWAVIVLIIQVLMPWAFAKFGPRFGWTQQTPGWWNLAGIIAVVIGLGLYAWCLVFYSPPALVRDGPYRISRNPMYVSGLFVWFGWVVTYGSPVVFLALVVLWVMFAFRVIPHEERLLEDLFGDEYLEYKKSVRRWIGWI
jgi:protein-S-isoprenylcysteine O-methyltransferase Ste14